MNPFLIESERDLALDKACTVGIYHVKLTVLRQTEGESIDAHTTCSVKVHTTGIVAYAVDLAKTCC